MAKRPHSEDDDDSFDLSKGFIVGDDSADEPVFKREEGSFVELKLSRPLLKQLHAFGYDEPTEIQRRAIPLALANQHVWAVSATGTGKTAAFLLPILQWHLTNARPAKSHCSLILLPTRELAVQCFEAANKYLLQKSHTAAVNILCLAGGLPKGQQMAELQRLRHTVDVVIGTPGRVLDVCASQPGVLRRCRCLVLDEADRLLAEGFAEELIRLKAALGLTSESPSLAEKSPSSLAEKSSSALEEKSSENSACPYQRRLQVLLFSATLADNVGSMARQLIGEEEAFAEVLVDSASALAPNLRQCFYRLRQTDLETRLASVVCYLKSTNHHRVLVFVNQKIDIARVVEAVRTVPDVLVHALHGDLSQSERLESLRAFLSDSSSADRHVLVATDVAARGLDAGLFTGSSVKSQAGIIDAVVNFQMPSTYATYQHRVGRTARAGRFGLAVSLVGPSERKFLKEAQRHAPFEHGHLDARTVDQIRHQLRTIKQAAKDDDDSKKESVDNGKEVEEESSEGDIEEDSEDGDMEGVDFDEE